MDVRHRKRLEFGTSKVEHDTRFAFHLLIHSSANVGAVSLDKLRQRRGAFQCRGVSSARCVSSFPLCSWHQARWQPIAGSAVAVVIESPADAPHPYKVHFNDGREAFAMPLKLKIPVQPPMILQAWPLLSEAIESERTRNREDEGSKPLRWRILLTAELVAN
jgi:hypothetical protein